jgi:hypothetical protein
MEQTPEPVKIELEQKTLNYLNTARKWSMFLAIIGFIGLGLLLIIGVATGTFLSAFNSGAEEDGIPEKLLIILWGVITIIYFFPVYFLFKFSKHSANAVHTHDKKELHRAIRNLKSFFVYIGVLVIIILVVYVLTLAIAGASMSFLKGI